MTAATENEKSELACEPATVQPIVKRSKPWPKIVPPFNPMEMMILNNAKRWM
jgi:hypothetical protein